MYTASTMSSAGKDGGERGAKVLRSLTSGGDNS